MGPNPARLKGPRAHGRCRGTAGVAYLQEVMDVVLFPELWEVRRGLHAGGRGVRYPERGVKT